MEQVSKEIKQNLQTNYNLQKCPLIELQRRFRAPVEQVWRAWMTPDLVRLWWGPAFYTCPEARIDFRVGGEYVFAMQGPDKKVNWSGGVYKEIEPNEKIVCTDHFLDEKCNPISANDAGLPGEWPDELFLTLTFKRTSNDETEMHLYHEGIPKAMHNDCIEGWNTSLDKLQRLVERS